MTAETTLDEFPLSAIKWLQAFYEPKKASTTEAKIKVLRSDFDLDRAFITADGGINGAEDELRMLEFYVLTKHGMI